MHTKTFGRFAAAGVIGCALLTSNGCSDNESPLAPAASAAFQVRLTPAGGTQSNGIMRFEIAGDQFTALVQAVGVEPGQRIPQHIHVNPTCSPGGGILINLDQNLTVAGEGSGVGAAYPVADASGYLNYRATRPVADLIAAVNKFFPTAQVQDLQGLLTFLNLEQRNAHMHVAFGPPFPAVNCGEIDRVK